MKKSIAVFILLFIFTIYAILPVNAQEPEINSPSAILIDASTGRILFEKNIHEKMYPASITKIMTAVLALEKGNLDDMVTASYNSVMSIDAGSSNIGLLPEEQLSLENLLYGLMVNSANEAANIIAEHISGSIDEFVNLMNQRAKELGAYNTHFVNTNGLHDDNHYTTAYDMTLIAKHAMTFPKFREIVQTIIYELPPTNKMKEIRYLSNTNLLINYYKSRKYIYEPAIGIKTGYTSKAGHTLVAAAKKGDLELISVVMCAKLEGNKNYCYEDTIALFQYGFNDFSIQTVVKSNDVVHEVTVEEAKDNQHVLLLTEKSLSALLPDKVDKSLIVPTINLIDEIKAPVKKNVILGSVSYTYQNQLLGEVNLIADRDVESDPILVIKNRLIQFANKKWVKYTGMVILSLFLIRIAVLKLSPARKRSYRRRKVRNYRYIHK